MPKIDTELYHLIKFTLPNCCNGTLDVEISAEYGPSHDAPDTMIADVWGMVKDCKLKGYLYTETIPTELVDQQGYTAVTHTIIDNPVFTKELQSLLNWLAQNNIIQLD